MPLETGLILSGDMNVNHYQEKCVYLPLVQPHVLSTSLCMCISWDQLVYCGVVTLKCFSFCMELKEWLHNASSHPNILHFFVTVKPKQSIGLFSLGFDLTCVSFISQTNWWFYFFILILINFAIESIDNLSYQRTL